MPGLDPPVVGQPDVDRPVRAQPVRGLVTGDAQLRQVDDDLQRVELVGGLGADQFVVQDVQAGQVRLALPDLAGQVEASLSSWCPCWTIWRRQPSIAA